MNGRKQTLPRSFFSQESINMDSSRRGSDFSTSNYSDQDLLLGFQAQTTQESRDREMVRDGFRSLEELYESKTISTKEYRKRRAFLEAYKEQQFHHFEVEEEEDSEEEEEEWSEHFHRCIGGCMRCGQTLWQAIMAKLS